MCDFNSGIVKNQERIAKIQSSKRCQRSCPTFLVVMDLAARKVIDGASDEKSLVFLCVTMCRRAFDSSSRGTPKFEKWGSVR